MTIDLPKFCADDESLRLDLQSPFSAGEYTYASNGRILIRVPRREGVKDGGPNLSKILPDLEVALATRSFAPVPAYEVVPGKTWPPETCRDCKGSGKIKSCRKCGGEGAVECGSCGQDADCGDCEGAGCIAVVKDAEGEDISTCEDCDGAGEVESMQSDTPDIARFPGHDFRTEYIDLIKELPGLEVALSPAPATVWGDALRAAMAFRFDGGCGLIMPIVRPAVETAEAAE